MKMRLFALIVFLLAIPFVVADINAAINVQYQPGNYSITVNVIDKVTGDALASVENTTDTNGNAILIYTTTSKKEVSYYVIVRKEGKIVKTQQFDDFVTGNDASLDVREKAVAPASVVQNTTNTTNVSAATSNASVVNDTANITAVTNVTNESEKATTSEKTISGAAVEDVLGTTEQFIESYGMYLVGLLVILVVIYLIVHFWPQYQEWKKQTHLAMPVKKERDIQVKDRELLGAERKLKQLESEITHIKERNRKVVEAERKYEDAKRELERARRGSF